MKILIILSSVAVISFIIPMFLVVIIGSMFGNHNTSNASAATLNGLVPNPYRQIILDAKDKVGCEGISPDIIAGQIRLESNFNPNANNGIAMGIAQFKPSTFNTNAVDGDNDGKTDIFNAADSIFSEYKYMCKLYNHFFDVKTALSQYNCGCNDAKSYVTMVLDYASQYSQFDHNCGNCSDLASKITALQQKHDWGDKCELFVENAFNLSGKYPTAMAHYKDMLNKGNIHTDNPPPPGKILYFDPGNIDGHVAISLPDNMVASTDILVHGDISIVTWDGFNYKWHAKYLGWSDPIW